MHPAARAIMRLAGLAAALWILAAGFVSLAPNLAGGLLAPWLGDLREQGIADVELPHVSVDWEWGQVRVRAPLLRVAAQQGALRFALHDTEALLLQQRSLMKFQAEFWNLDVGRLEVDIDLDLWPRPQVPPDYDEILALLGDVLDRLHFENASIRETEVRVLRRGAPIMRLELEQAVHLHREDKASLVVAGRLDGRPISLQWGWRRDLGSWLLLHLPSADYARLLPANLQLRRLDFGLDLEARWPDAPPLRHGWRRALPDSVGASLHRFGVAGADWEVASQTSMEWGARRTDAGGYSGGVLPWKLLLRGPAGGGTTLLHETPAIAVNLDDDLHRARITVESLELRPLLRMLTSLEVLPDVAQRYLLGMDPRVTLRDLALGARLDAEDFFGGASARVLAASASSIPSTLPGLQGLAGRLWLGPGGEGLVVLDTPYLSLDLKGFFRSPWEFGGVQAHLRWRLAADSFHISVTDITGHLAGSLSQGLRGSPEDARVAGQVYVGIPFDASLPQRLEAQVEAAEFPIRHAWRFAPTLPGLEGISSYLEASLLDGLARDFKLSVSANLTGPPGFGLHLLADGEDLTMQYAPDWPRVEGGRARLEVLDSSVRVLAQAGSISGVEASSALIQVDPMPAHPGWTQVQLTADFGSESLADGLRFLRESPIAEILGTPLQLASASGPWRGSTREALIHVPPANHGEVGINDIFQGQVDIVLQGSALAWEEWSVDLRQLRGEVTYDSHGPMRSRGLAARVFGLPFHARLGGRGAPGAAGGHALVRFRGAGGVADLRPWLNVWSRFGDGIADFDGQLRIPWDQDDPVTLSLHTDLVGVALRMPPPFVKHGQERLPTHLVLSFPPASNPQQDSHLWLQTALYCADLDLDEHDLGGLIQLGGASGCEQVRPDSPFPSHGRRGIHIRGHAETLEFEPILAFAQEVAQVAEADDSSAGLRTVEVSADRLRALGDALEDVRLRADEKDDGMAVQIRSERASGEIWIPEADDEPVEAIMERLHLREISEDNSAAFDPANFGLLRLVVEDLRWRESHLGTWTVHARPVPGGVEIDLEEVRTPEGELLDLSYHVSGRRYPFSITWIGGGAGREQTLVRGGIQPAVWLWANAFSADEPASPAPSPPEASEAPPQRVSGASDLVDIGSLVAGVDLAWEGPPTAPKFETLRGSLQAHLQDVDIDFDRLGGWGGIPWISQLLGIRKTVLSAVQFDLSSGLFSDIWLDLQATGGELEFQRLSAVGGFDLNLSGFYRFGSKGQKDSIQLQGGLTGLDKLVGTAILVGNPVAWLGYEVINAVFGGIVKQVLTYDISLSGPLDDLSVAVRLPEADQGRESGAEVVSQLVPYPCSAQQQYSGAAEEEAKASYIGDRCYYYSPGNGGVQANAVQ